MGPERRRSAAGATRQARRPDTAGDDLPSSHAAILRLESAAGNRATTAALASITAQRAPDRAGVNTAGELALDGAAPIRIQSATWSEKATIKELNQGQTRSPSIERGRRDIGDIVVTRRATRESTAIPDWFGATYAHGALRLDRPSRDGALPATSIALVDAVIASYERTATIRRSSGSAWGSATSQLRGMPPIDGRSAVAERQSRVSSTSPLLATVSRILSFRSLRPA